MDTNKIDNQNHEIEIDLLALAKDILKKWWVLAIGLVVGSLVVLSVNSFLVTPRYRASAMLYVLGSTTSITSFADVQIGGALAEDFLLIAQSKPVIDGAIRIASEQGLYTNREEIHDMLSVSATGTRMITITATHPDARVAQIVADAVSHAAMTRIEQVTHSDPPSLVEMAEVPHYPLPSRLTVPIGGLGGMVIAIAFLALRFILNDHIKSEDDVYKFLDLNTLVVIPVEGKG